LLRGLVEQLLDDVDLRRDLQLGPVVAQHGPLRARRQAVVHEAVELRGRCGGVRVHAASEIERAWSFTLPSNLCSVAISLSESAANASTIQRSCWCAISWKSLRPLAVSRTR